MENAGMINQTLLTALSILMACAVSIQAFFAAKVWSHERRLVKLETEHGINHDAGQLPACPYCRPDPDPVV